MSDTTQLSEYGSILVFLLVGIVLVCLTIFMSKVVSKQSPNPIKNSTYECGEEVTGTAWSQFNPRFYVVALVFLLFDVELIFVFPWATVFGDAELNRLDPRWGWFALMDMFVFLGILMLGLVYVWVRGDLSWVRVSKEAPFVSVNIPSSVYAALNAREYSIRAIKDENEGLSVETSLVHPKSPTSIKYKPRFKNKSENE